MRAIRLLIVCLFVLILRTSIQTSWAQSVYGRITGSLSDISGHSIIGAKVSILSLSKGTKFTALTDRSGFYTVNDVPPDDYNLKVEADGYKTFQNPLITVYADNTSQMNVRMVKGTAADIVTGSASDVSILKLDRTDVSTILSRRNIADVPIRHQNTSSLELLAPGTAPANPVLPLVQNPQAGTYISVNGQNFSGTAYQLDGTDNRDPLEGIVVINPNEDAIGEMKITTQNYGAEFGEATAGVVTAQTRSGSNALHGTAFMYRQSSFGQASDPNLFTSVATGSGTQIVPPVITNSVLKRNDFGASLAGAFIKNRLFFFVDYRGTRDSSGATIHQTVPTALVHTSCIGPPATSDCNLSDYQTPINAPYTDTGNGNTEGIPNNLLSPQTVHLLSLLPLPNLPGAVNNFIATGHEPFDSDAPDVRIDYGASQKLKVFGRYSIADFRQEGTPAYGAAGGPGANPDTFAGRARTRNQEISSGFSYSLNPELLTDFRFGYLRYHLSLDAPDFGTFPLNLNSSAGIRGLNTDLFSSDLPDIQILGLQNLGPTTTTDFVRFGFSPAASSCNCPLREREQQFQWINNWIKLVSRHAIHWGGDFRYIQNFRLNSTASRSGHLQFGRGNTDLTLGDFLIGQPSFFNRTYSDPTNPVAFSAGERQKRAFLYGEDTWRVTSRFTLNYGLRWELYFPQSVTSSGAGGFLLIHGNMPPSINNLITMAGRGGVNLQGNVQNTFRNFGPRLGFAYLVGSKTVIRAGYGRSFDIGYSGSLFGIAATENPPVASVLRDNNGFPINIPTGPADVTTYTRLVLPPSDSFTVEQLCMVNNPTVPTTCDPTNAANNSSPARDAALFALPAKLRVPTVDAWNATVQRELSSNMYFEVAYVGNKGTHVLTDGIYTNSGLSSGSAYDLNQPSEAGYIQTTSTSAPNPKCTKNIVIPGYCTTKPFARTLLTPWVAPLLYFGNSASNNYQSLQATFRRRFSKGVSVLAHYSFSKVQDYAPIYFSTDPRVAFGPGDFDRRHAIVVENIWSLPVGHGRTLLGNSGGALDKILGGWSLNTITSWYSGLPFTPTYSKCNRDLGQGSVPCRPNVVGHVHIIGNRREYFSTSGIPLPAANNLFCGLDASGNPQPGPAIGPWQRPGCGQIGNAGRNSLRGPRFFQSDVSLMKEFVLKERVSLRLRVDAFNVFNKVNLANPDPTVDSPQGGTITSSANQAFQRQFEFSAKLQF